MFRLSTEAIHSFHSHSPLGVPLPPGEHCKSRVNVGDGNRNKLHKPYPLALTTTDKLVNHTLGRVGEIAKLSLPDHKGIGVHLTVITAVLYRPQKKREQKLIMGDPTEH